MNREIQLGNHIISEESSIYIVAELSANHNMDYDRACAIIEAAAEAGADAVKIQTYTADTITIDCNAKEFQAHGLWEGMSLYQLYQKAYTPWEWQEGLIRYANGKGLDCFSSPFDFTAVDFLESLHVPAYKIASYEINDIPLIKKAAQTGKPVILSTGIARLSDIELAVHTCKEAGNENVILLKCVSAYPAPLEEMNLRVIPNMGRTFGCLTGLSDHTLGAETAVAAVALGAKVIEKHLTLKRKEGGVDSAFSMEQEEFADMVSQIRRIEKALGTVTYDLNQKQEESRLMSRSLFAVKDIRQGETLTAENIRSIRPGTGLHTKYYEDILGKTAREDLKKGTPLDWALINK
ncbi:MAG: pseudaminic acid synthase [Lachnospiraceae bacterium]|nr:pseudaminic acid synthase [Lachnospiraceae bacterium]